MTKKSSRTPAPPSEDDPFEEKSSFPWGVIWAIVTLAALVVFRRFLRAMFPLLFVLLVAVPLLVYLFRKFRYRDLDEVYDEYAPLSARLRELGYTTYATIIDGNMARLVSVRDRVENIRMVLRRETVKDQEKKVADLRADLLEAKSPASEPDRKALKERTLQDAQETLDHLKKLEEFLGRYVESKKLLAGHFRSLLLKLKVGELDRTGETARLDELDRIVRGIESADEVFREVDRPPPSRETE